MMSYKTYVGGGKYCYTPNCKRHAEAREAYTSASKLIDRRNSDLAAYYAGTERKHFSDRSLPGSKFTDPKITTLDDLLVLTAQQRGNLDGDDSDKFRFLGVKDEVFKAGFRYLMVATSGKLGIVTTDMLPGDAVVTVERTKPGAPCNFVMSVKKQLTVDYGVVIISDEDPENPQLITAFPGYPTFVPDRSEESVAKADSLEGQSFTVDEVRERMNRDVVVNTRLV